VVCVLSVDVLKEEINSLKSSQVPGEYDSNVIFH